VAHYTHHDLFFFHLNYHHAESAEELRMPLECLTEGNKITHPNVLQRLAQHQQNALSLKSAFNYRSDIDNLNIPALQI